MKHVPIRTCVGCRQRRAKRELVRLARRPDGVVVVDAEGSRPGRGAYVCAEPGCAERPLKTGRLGRAFRATCRLGEGLESTVLAGRHSTAVAGHDTGPQEVRGTWQRRR
ncbi:MAG: YlxR family protein [Candidatus Rokuibacteriota bacterium]|nr:MAG: YlxR family protein [Candidatus Rokubacteria bacterium]